MRWMVMLMVVFSSFSVVEGSLFKKANIETRKAIRRLLKKKHNPVKMNLRISSMAQFRRDHS